MPGHRRALRLAALAVAVAVVLPLCGTSTVASAKARAGCHKTRTCKSGAGAPSGSGTGGTAPPLTVQIDPTPAVETGSSFVLAVVQVETSAAYAGDAVDLSSNQFAGSCQSTTWLSHSAQNTVTPTLIILTLDNDGNAQALMEGRDCAPGDSVVEADLAVAPFFTALGTLVVGAPAVTTPGVFGYPTSSGTVTGGDVETGDVAVPSPGGPVPEESDVAAVFEVETSPVYAEQTVEISSPELQARCSQGWEFVQFNNQPGHESVGFGSVITSLNATAADTLDDDGNALFWFLGSSCAAGPSTVIADVLAGTHPTYTSTFTVLPPQPTI